MSRNSLLAGPRRCFPRECGGEAVGGALIYVYRERFPRACGGGSIRVDHPIEREVVFPASAGVDPTYREMRQYVDVFSLRVQG